MKLRVPVVDETIGRFYRRVAEQLGWKDEEIAAFDCTKICCSVERFEAIQREHQPCSSEQFGMMWTMCGPKALDTLESDEVQIEDGFIELI